ncbi:antibiotic biosynthesis monooxygenase family protein [Thermonema rossianum]|uniref:antibiotic biosynthesis monooxygenase family protein n=1 Tax=Thermonema rossianum TaxID=55505 RepID=UPI0005710165|nr:antibiotic biosynthesis monooxygenase [Thermonema rossianum]
MLATPYYAVIFTSLLKDGGHAEYEAVAQRMVELAALQEGFLGVESARTSAGLGITVSYWQDKESIRRWREHALHQIAIERGQKEWYRHYCLRICKVEYQRCF